MGYGDDQLNVSGTFTTYFFLRHFHTTTVADDAFVADALILSAMTLIVFGRTEYALAEKAIALGLIGSIVDRFGLQYLAIRIFQDFLRRGQPDGNLRKITLYLVFSLKCHIV